MQLVNYSRDKARPGQGIVVVGARRAKPSLT